MAQLFLQGRILKKSLKKRPCVTAISLTDWGLILHEIIHVLQRERVLGKTAEEQKNYRENVSTSSIKGQTSAYIIDDETEACVLSVEIMNALTKGELGRYLIREAKRMRNGKLDFQADRDPFAKRLFEGFPAENQLPYFMPDALEYFTQRYSFPKSLKDFEASARKLHGHGRTEIRSQDLLLPPAALNEKFSSPSFGPDHPKGRKDSRLHLPDKRGMIQRRH